MHFDDLLRFFIKKKLSLNSLFDSALKLQFINVIYLLKCSFFYLRKFLYHKIKKLFSIFFLISTKCCICPPVDFSKYKVAHFGASYP